MVTSPQPRNVVAKSLGMLACLVALFIFTSVPLTAGAEEGISGSGQGSAPASVESVSPQAAGSAAPAAAPRATYSPVEQSDGTWLCTVKSEWEYEKALDEIAGDVPEGAEVTICATASFSEKEQYDVEGVAGRSITLTADEGVTFTVRLGESLEGDLTLDRVRLNLSYNSDETWCNGFHFETTENTTAYISGSSMVYGTTNLYGGSDGTDVASTDIVLKGGAFENVYAGGSDGGAVTGDTSLVIGGSVTVKKAAFGGGLDGTVGGDTHVTLEDQASAKVFGGGEDANPDVSDTSDATRTDAAVAGTAYVTVTSSANGGTVYGGSIHSTVGNVRMDVTKATGWVYGTGEHDTIKGTVEIKYNCSGVSEAKISGTGDSGYNTGAGPIRVLNEGRSDQAITIDYTAAVAGGVTDFGGSVYHFSGGDAEVKGDVVANIYGGSPESLQSRSSTVDVTVNGDTVYNILGTTHTYYVEGLRAEAESDDTTYTTSVNVAAGVTFTTSLVQQVDLFDIADGADVRITGWSPASKNWGNDPFQGTVSLVRIGANAVLDTNPQGCSLSGSVEMDEGATWRVRGPITVEGDFTIDGAANLQLPVVANGKNYHDEGGTIPLRIEGAASGTAKVQLMARDFAASGESVPVNVAAAADIEEGQDYIIARGNGDDPVAGTFTLANADVPEGLSLGRVTDPKASDNYLWQIVAEPVEAHVIYSFSSGTRGGSLPDEVTDLLPVDGTVYSEGETVTAIQPEHTTVLGPKNSSDDTPGVWTFEGYKVNGEPADEVVLSEDVLNKDGYVEFKGTWTWSALVEDSLSYDKNADAATGSTGPSEGYEGQPVKVAENGFTRVGYTFTGWNTEADGSGDDVAAGDEYTLTAGEDVLYAQWECTAEPLVPTAVSLTAYEGGAGSSANPDDALPEPVWLFEAEDWTLYIDGEEQDGDAAAFQWGYFVEGSADEQTGAATRGVYELRVWPLAGDPEVVAVAADGEQFILDLDGETAVKDEAGEPVTVAVRDVTDDDAAVSLSEELFRPVYGAASSVSTMSARSVRATAACDGTCDTTAPHAHVAEGTTFERNAIDGLAVNAEANVQLLFDGFIDGVLGDAGRMDVLDGKARAAAGSAFGGDAVEHDFRYLDLVDTNDGNVWVAPADGSSVTVFIPYSGTMTAESEIAVVYFDGLTRDYTIDMDAADLDAEIAGTNAHALSVTKTADGITFEVPYCEFGPFEIMWVDAEQTGDDTPTGPVTPVNPDIPAGPDGPAGGQGSGSAQAGNGGTLVATGDALPIMGGAIAAAGAALAAIGVARRRHSR
ncbi:SHIRT domain-containing protein [Enorma burkinafasonensis]|uniref:SHIRT domain-containing protein n=1 Tax=Enorma burkinafasonensis TaxID=2590867 RepID=UPI0011AADD1E|nr:SHIRT domain-containing protein [Enorma burkinafasonensis]